MLQASWGMMNKALLSIAFVMAALSGCSKHQSSASVDDDTVIKSSAADKVAVDAVLQVAELDTSVFSEISDKLEGACYRNRFGLTEDACIQTIRMRKHACTYETIQKYPGKLASADSRQEVATNYVDCLFQS
jgi:hypothetical protein